MTMVSHNSKEIYHRLFIHDCWGVATFRVCTGFPSSSLRPSAASDRVKTEAASDLLYDCTLGCHIIRWNVSQKKRILSFQASQDLITGLVRSPSTGMILSVSFSGDGGLWNETYKKEAVFSFPSNNVIFAAWSTYQSLFGITSKGPNAKIGLYLVTRKNDQFQIRQSSEIVCPQDTVPTNGIENKYNCYNAISFTPDSNLIAVFETFHRPCEVHLYSSQGILCKVVPVSPLQEPETSLECISGIKNDRICVGIQGGMFQYINWEDLSPLEFFQATGSAQVCLWDKQHLLTVAYLSGHLTWWDENGSIVAELSGAPESSIVHLNWEREGESLWVGGLMSLYYMEIRRESEVTAHVKYSLEKHLLSGCGLAISNNDLIASGDLKGSIFIWKSGINESVCDTSVNEMVRCLLWSGNSLLIGTLEGTLYQCKDINICHDSLIPCSIVTTNGGITSLANSPKDSKVILGTTMGFVYSFEYGGNDYFQEKGCFLVHSSQDGKVMEVWSVCFHPTLELFASASEDNTCCIAKLNTGEKVATLTGHTMAVTSVKWKQREGEQRSILATCSDDRTVRSHDGNTYEILFVVNTYDIYGWHTLTYLDIDLEQDILLCSTQNGYVVGWNLSSQACILQRRIHNGSIEGLCYAPHLKRFVTIGSDGTVCSFSLSAFAE